MPIVDIAIICALDVEAKAMCQHLRGISESRLGPYRCHYGHIERRGDPCFPLVRVVVLQMDRMGNLASLHAATLLLRETHPQYLFLVGICGGFAKSRRDYRYGDIVVSDRVFYYEPQKQKPRRNENRGRDLFWSATGAGAYKRSSLCALADRRRGRAHLVSVDIDLIKGRYPGVDHPHYRPTTHVGVVCSGEKLVADEAFVDELLKLKEDAISVEMEAAGVATACVGTSTSFLVIKAVTDFADQKKSDKFRKFAAEAAAAYTLTLITFPFHGAVRPPGSDDIGLNFANRTPPSSFLADFIRASPDKGLFVVMPSYPNPRHEQLRLKFTNYPFNEWETAFDDVYCTFRIIPHLMHLGGGRKSKLEFEKRMGNDDLPTDRNVVLIGSSVSNVFTRRVLDEYNARYLFDKEPDYHDIIDCEEGQRFGAKERTVRQGGKDLRDYYEDYGMVSVFHDTKHCRSLCILAGCRAFSQLLLGDFLGESEFLEMIYRHVYGCDYQCIIRVGVVSRMYHFKSIAALVKRPQQKDAWTPVRLPEGEHNKPQSFL